jgi:outer membrane protein assembly factor BamD (BamD/ComL family)
MPRLDLRPFIPAIRRVGGLLLLLAAAPGCQTDTTGILARWRAAHDDGLAKPVSAEEINDKRGPIAQWLVPKSGPATNPNPKSTLVLGSNGWTPPKPVNDPAADKELKEAEALIQQGRLDEAEKAYKAIAKKRKETNWGERAQFALAELQFKRENYVGANDAYQELMKDYAGTRYRDKVAEREYAIAQIWLSSIEDSNPPPDKNKDKGKDKTPAKPKFSWLDRFSGKLPLVDTSGHALQTLEHVRHHDVDGPLADDAVLRIADYHYDHGNWEDASINYDQLLAEHPKSPFVRRAQLASIDAKLKNYLGPEYDGSGLDQAKGMIRNHLETFPERLAGQNDPLYKALDLIEDQEAERAYIHGEHYLWTGHVLAAEYTFGEIPVRWPKSTWAKKAKIQLAQIAKMPRKESRPSKIMSRPGSSDPLTGGSGAGMGMGGMSGAPGSMMGGGMNNYGN